MTGIGELRRGLVMLMTNSRHGRPEPIGTGFLIKCFDKTAIALTATHNLTAIKSIQTGPIKHHPTALREFIAQDVTLNLTRPNIYALSFNNERVKNCQVLWAISEEKSDVSVLCLDCSDDPDFFCGEFLISEQDPALGDKVAVLGFADTLETADSERSTDAAFFSFNTRPLLRVGKVTEKHPDGHLLCRGSSVSTNIPVFPGMSGGPAFHFDPEGRQIEVFGLICSDSAFEDISTKNDRAVPGRSTLAVLDREVVVDEKGMRSIRLRMREALVHPTSQV